MKKPNNTLLCDFYELTMANGYFQSDLKDDIAVFDLFFRRVPDGGGYAISIKEVKDKSEAKGLKRL